MSFSLKSLRRERRPPPVPPPSISDGIGPGDYWQVGEHTVTLIEQLAGIRASDRVLDVGCGPGRIAWPLSHRLGWRGSYVGLDPVKAYIDWCSEQLGLPRRRFQFRHADVRNSAYNVAGAISPERYVFPWPDASFDLVVSTSVFTHLLPDAARNYLAQISRSLRSGGRLFCSFFILDAAGLAAAAAGTSYPTLLHPIPEGRLHDPEVPDAGVAFDPRWLVENFERCGLQVASLHPGSWKGAGIYYQDIIVARKL